MIKRVIPKSIHKPNEKYHTASKKRKKLYDIASSIYVGGNITHGFNTGRRLHTLIDDIEKRYSYVDIPEQIKERAKEKYTPPIKNQIIVGSLYGAIRGYNAHRTAREHQSHIEQLDDFYTNQRSRGVSKKVALKKTGKEATFHIGKILISRKIGSITAKATLKGIHHLGYNHSLVNSVIGLGSYRLGYKVTWRLADKLRSTGRRIKKEYLKNRLEGKNKVESFKKGFNILVRR